MQTESEAALFGAAYRAAYGFSLDKYGKIQTMKNYSEYILGLTPNQLELVCEPNSDSESIYEPMLRRYQEMASILENPQGQSAARLHSTIEVSE